MDCLCPAYIIEFRLLLSLLVCFQRTVRLSHSHLSNASRAGLKNRLLNVPLSAYWRKSPPHDGYKSPYAHDSEQGYLRPHIPSKIY